MTIPRIGVILVSVREGRVGERIARWFLSIASARTDLTFECIDLKDWPLPAYGYAMKPSQIEHEYPDELPRRWVELIEGLDGFIAVTPEYNFSYPGHLKTAMDYVVKGWERKPFGVVSYGGISGGLRSAEQLRHLAVNFGLAVTPGELAFPRVSTSFPPGDAPVDPASAARATKLLDDFAWWVVALRTARAGTSSSTNTSSNKPSRTLVTHRL